MLESHYLDFVVLAISFVLKQEDMLVFQETTVYVDIALLILIQDVYHRYSEARLKFIYPWYKGGNSFHSFCNIMQATNEDNIKNIPLFVNEIMKCKDKENV